MSVLFVDLAWVYTGLGTAMALAFLTVGIGRVMPDARGALVFRLLVAPGVILLWPAVLWRWVQLERGSAATWGAAQHRPPRRAQTGAALALMILVPVILFGALVVRQDGPRETAPVRLDPPGEPAE